MVRRVWAPDRTLGSRLPSRRVRSYSSNVASKTIRDFTSRPMDLFDRRVSFKFLVHRQAILLECR